MKVRNVGRTLLVLLLVLASDGCFYSSDFSQWKTPAAHQRSVANTYLPAELEVPGAYHRGRVRVFRARVYVDQDYRQRPHWKDHAGNLLRAANSYTGSAFGVVLDVTFVDWKRSSPGADLRVILGELTELDEGVDVDWVIGLCAAPATFTASHHDLGMAMELGKHFVVRDMNDVQEVRQIAQVYDQMSEQDRLALYAARKAHKELVVFLHEWGHTLGALHERGEGRIMGPNYDREASTFSEPDAGLIERGLVLRGVTGTSPTAVKAHQEAEAQMLAFYRANAGWEEWFEDEKAELVGLLGGEPTAASSPSGGATGGAPAAEKKLRLNLPRAAVLAYNRAVEAMRAGHNPEAWSELEPIVTSFPDAVDVQRLACRLGALEVGGDEALAACARVLRLDPTDSDSPLWQANAMARAASPDDARVQALLDEVEARLARKQGADATAGWLQLAQVAYSMGALTSAEHALAHLGGNAEAVKLGDSVRDSRRLVGLPPDGARVGVPRAKEAAYFRAFKVAYDKFMAEPRFAGEQITAELAHFPDAPGLLALACGVDAYSHKAAAARKLCARALHGWDETMLAHYFAAQAAEGAAEAILHLERVLALDPGQRGAWINLGGLYDRTKATEKKRALMKDYKERFGETLPTS